MEKDNPTLSNRL